jgi:hypothetical protein
MSHYRQIAERMKWFYFFEKEPLTRGCCCTTLVTSCYLALVYLFVMEIFFVLFFNLYFGFYYTHALIIANGLVGLRMLVIIVLFVALNQNNFLALQRTIIAFEFLTLVQIILVTVLFFYFILCENPGFGNYYYYYDSRNYRRYFKCMHYDDKIAYGGIAFPLVILNVYIGLMLYSYTKSLGLSRDPTGAVPVAYVPAAGVYVPPVVQVHQVHQVPVTTPRVMVHETVVQQYGTNPQYNINQVPTNPYNQNVSFNPTGVTYQNNFNQNTYDNYQMEKLILTHQDDINFASRNQNAIVSDMTLPSGIRVPSPMEGRVWRIVGSEVLLL